MKEIKLKQLEKSFEEGLVSKKEYEKKKKEIEEMPEPKREVEEDIKEAKLKSDKMLIVIVIIIVLVFAFIFGSRYFTPEPPKTIDELHEFNIKGKLKPDQGYLYNDVYSFVKFEDLWYTQLTSPKGTRLYDMQFRYGPRGVGDINIDGTLNTDLFNNAADYYVTFNPTGNALQGEDIELKDNDKKIYLETNEINSIIMHIMSANCIIIHDPQPLPLINFYKKKQPWVW